MTLNLTCDALRDQLCASQRDACDHCVCWSRGAIALPATQYKPIRASVVLRYFPSARTMDTGRVGIHLLEDADGIHTVLQRRSNGHTTAWTIHDDASIADTVYVTRKPLAALLNEIAEQRRRLFCSDHWVAIKAINDSLPQDVLNALDPRGVDPASFYAYNSSIALPCHCPVFWSAQLTLGILYPLPAQFQAIRLADGTWLNPHRQKAAMLQPYLLWAQVHGEFPAEAILLYSKQHIPLKNAIANIERLKPSKAVCIV